MSEVTKVHLTPLKSDADRQILRHVQPQNRKCEGDVLLFFFYFPRQTDKRFKKHSDWLITGERIFVLTAGQRGDTLYDLCVYMRCVLSNQHCRGTRLV